MGSLDSECVFMQRTLDCKKKTLINISKPQGRPLITKTGCGAAERETDRWNRKRDLKKGGRMQCFMKKKDKSLIDVEYVETTGERCCHLS